LLSSKSHFPGWSNTNFKFKITENFLPNISVILLPLFRPWIMIYLFQSCLLSWSLIFWWTWFWVNSGSWQWTGRPGVLRFMGLQRVGHTERLKWLTGHKNKIYKYAVCDSAGNEHDSSHHHSCNSCEEDMTFL